MQRLKRYAGLLAEREVLVDLAISVRIADVCGEGDARTWRPETDDEILRVGGRWNRHAKRWMIEPADTQFVLRFHRGQEPAARWLAEWLRRRVDGDWEGFRRAYSALLIGGRRAGKTHLAAAFLALYAVTMPAARVWAVSPTLETGEELDLALRDLLPRAWYEVREQKTGEARTFRLANGSRIALRSGAKAKRLKMGRADVVLLNEAQMQPHGAYINVRGAIADRQGLVVVAANPPDDLGGLWLEDLYNGVQRADVDGVAFELDPRSNPFVDAGALLAMSREVDEKTFEREVLGIFTPIGDRVFYGWSDVECWRDPPPDLVDITAAFTRRRLGRSFAYVMGFDFQQHPAMVAVAAVVFQDPDDPDEQIAWIVDEWIVGEADEYELLDAIEQTPRWTPTGPADDCYRGWREPSENGDRPVHAAVIADASGWFQDGGHNRGQTSDQKLRARKWAGLYKPSPDSDKNPAIIERVRATNARIKSHAGKRRLFVAKRCVQTAEALRRWENVHGTPHRRSPYAHLSDCVSYLAYRLWGRPKVPRDLEFRPIVQLTRRRELDAADRMHNRVHAITHLTDPSRGGRW
jgi:hypothetical protein